MKCSKCGAEIPDNAAFCDICGAEQMQVETEVVPEPAKKAASGSRSKKPALDGKKKKIIIIAGVVLCAFILIGVIAGSVHDTYSKPVSKYNELSEVPYKVTPEMVSQLELGMSYDEVIAIIGGEGHKTDEYSDAVTYSWPGVHYNDKYEDSDSVVMYSELRLEFRGEDMRLWMIDENDVVDGEEIYQNEKNDKKAMTSLKEPELTQLKEFMTYEEIRDLLGTDGVLKGSSMYLATSYESRTKEYVWTYKHKDGNYEYNSNISVDFSNGKATHIYY